MPLSKTVSLPFKSRTITARLFLPAVPPRGIIYLHISGDEAIPEELFSLPAALVLVNGEDWNRDLSPWLAARAFRGGEAFAGGAPDYFSFFTCQLMPAAEAGLPAGLPRLLAGYSLAGLFALWALWQSDLFAGAASMSGSLWFDGFTDYLDRPPLIVPKGVSLSLGILEPQTKNTRLAAVGPCTRQVRARLEQLGIPVAWEEHPGGHFDGVEARTARGIFQAVQLLGW